MICGDIDEKVFVRKSQINLEQCVNYMCPKGYET